MCNFHSINNYNPSFGKFQLRSEQAYLRCHSSLQQVSVDSLPPSDNERSLKVLLGSMRMSNRKPGEIERGGRRCHRGSTLAAKRELIC